MSLFLSQFNFQIIQDGKLISQSAEALPSASPRKKWVFLHGLMGYGLNWRRIALSVSQNHQVLIFDQRGHGRSFRPSHGYAPRDFAEDLKQIVDELGWEEFYLCGHSMGGRNAVDFASAWPHRIEKLVIEDIGPDGRPEAVEYYRALFDSIPTPFPTKLRAKEFFMNEFARSAFGLQHGVTDTLGQYLYTNLSDDPVDWRFSPEAMLEIVRLGRAADQWDDFRKLNIPTLLVRGERSTDLDRGTFERVLLANPLIEGVEISNAGHWVHYDQAQAFIDELKRFTLE
jgi:pimeloyl-ACP methyl ester carboxylesterase